MKCVVKLFHAKRENSQRIVKRVLIRYLLTHGNKVHDRNVKKLRK